MKAETREQDPEMHAAARFLLTLDGGNFGQLVRARHLARLAERRYRFRLS